jgi:hypothetical protein
MRVQNGGKRPRHTQTSIDRQIHKNLFFLFFSFVFVFERKEKKIDFGSLLSVGW